MENYDKILLTENRICCICFQFLSHFAKPPYKKYGNGIIFLKQYDIP